MYGRFARTTSNGPPSGGTRSPPEGDPIADRVADRVLAGEVERIGIDVGGDDPRPPPSMPRARRPTARAIAIGAAARADVDDPDAARRAGAAPRSGDPATSSSASSTSRSVSGRGIRARGSAAKARPMELLDLRGRRRPARPPSRRSIAARSGPPRRPDRRFRVGDDGRPIDPEALAEQELGVQAWCLRAGRSARRSTASRSSPSTVTIERSVSRLRGRARRACRSRSAWSVVIRASISRSRSPSMTRGRLDRSSPIRWSVTRSCGKL